MFIITHIVFVPSSFAAHHWGTTFCLAADRLDDMGKASIIITCNVVVTSYSVLSSVYILTNSTTIHVHIYMYSICAN